MANSYSKEKIQQAILQVKHPEINSTLAELRMIKDVTVAEEKVIITMSLPIMGIPDIIKNYLVTSVQDALNKFTVKVEVKFVEMDQNDRDEFARLAQEKWIV
ncbi:DUF59 domain-containing protein [bacterium]|nr:DUF59 domain-containing protein [bacterium]